MLAYMHSTRMATMTYPLNARDSHLLLSFLSTFEFRAANSLQLQLLRFGNRRLQVESAKLLEVALVLESSLDLYCLSVALHCEGN